LPAERLGRAAVVDIGYLFKHHKGFAESMVDLKEQVKAVEAECRQEGDEIKRFVEKLEGLRPGTPEHERLEREIAHRRAELTEKTQLARKRSLRREAALYDATYDDIVDAVTRFAKEHGIAVVYRRQTQAEHKPPGIRSAVRVGVGDEVKPTGSTTKKSDVADDPASVLKKINREVVYRLADRRDITQDILDMLDRKQARPQGPEAEEGSGHSRP
jgi:Skp family chaperone for outer membrane proteins